MLNKIVVIEVKILCTDTSRGGANIQEMHVEKLQELAKKAIGAFLVNLYKGYYGYSLYLP